MKLRTSPYYILSFLYRYGLIALSLPLQAFLLKNASTHITAYVYTGNTVLLFILIVLACIHHKNLSLSLHDKNIIFEKGILIKSCYMISKKNFSVISTLQSPLQKLLKIRKVTFVFSKIRIPLFLSENILPCVSNKFTGKETPKRPVFKNGFIQTFFLSAGFHNALTGALTLIPVLKKLSALTAPSLARTQLTNSLNSIYIDKNINFILNSLTSAIIGLWGIGVLITFFRYFNLKVYRKESFIEALQGLFIKRYTSINTKNISCVVFRQNILMVLLHRYTGEFCVPCENKNGKITFICSEDYKTCTHILSLLTKSFNSNGNDNLCPHKKALFSYTLVPLVSLVVFSVLSVAADIYSPYISKTRFGLLITLWLCVWLIFRIMVFKRCLIACDNKVLLICTYSKFAFCKAHIPLNKVHSLKLTQTIFQKRRGSCSLRIFVKHCRPLSFKIRHIDKEKTAELTKNLCGK